MKKTFPNILAQGFNITQDTILDRKGDFEQTVAGIAIGVIVGGGVDYILGNNGVTGMEVGALAVGSIAWINNRVLIGYERVFRKSAS